VYLKTRGRIADSLGSAISTCREVPVKLFCCANLFLGVFAFAMIAQGQTTCPKNPKHTASVTYGVYDTGESLEGPVCVEVYYNALRNDVF